MRSCDVVSLALADRDPKARRDFRAARDFAPAPECPPMQRRRPMILIPQFWLAMLLEMTAAIASATMVPRRGEIISLGAERDRRSGLRRSRSG
jgi:hypothetical protein